MISIKFYPDEAKKFIEDWETFFPEDKEIFLENWITKPNQWYLDLAKFFKTAQAPFEIFIPLADNEIGININNDFYYFNHRSSELAYYLYRTMTNCSPYYAKMLKDAQKGMSISTWRYKNLAAAGQN